MGCTIIKSGDERPSSSRVSRTRYEKTQNAKRKEDLLSKSWLNWSTDS